MTTVNDIDWKFPVGKYKGRSLKEVASINYSYCRWFMNSSKTFYFEGQVIDLVRQINSRDGDGPSSLQTDCERMEYY